MAGVLSNPFVTLMYIIEQVSIFALGGSERSSDMRLVAFLVLDMLCIYTILTSADHFVLAGLALAASMVAGGSSGS
jgi:hypothetical protein